MANNKQYASGKVLHKAAYPGKQPINPAKHVAVVACMDVRRGMSAILNHHWIPTSGPIRDTIVAAAVCSG